MISSVVLINSGPFICPRPRDWIWHVLGGLQVFSLPHHHLTLIYHIDHRNFNYHCCNNLQSNYAVKAHWWLLVRCPSSSHQRTYLSTLRKDTGHDCLWNHLKSPFYRDNVLTTEGWQPLPTPGVQGWLALVFGGQTAWERLVHPPTSISTRSSPSLSGRSNENGRWEHWGALGWQHSWAGGCHQARDQLGCQVLATKPVTM